MLKKNHNQINNKIEYRIIWRGDGSEVIKN